MRKLARYNALLAMLLLSTVATMYGSGLVNCSTNPSDPACAPYGVLTYQVGIGSVQSIPIGVPTFDSTTGTWAIDINWQNSAHTLSVIGDVVTRPDPFISFSWSFVNNTTSTLTYAFDFVTPYAGGPYYTASTSYNDLLTNTKGVGTSTVAPVGSSFIANTFDTGALISSLGIGMGCTTSTVTFTCSSPDDGTIGPNPWTSNATGVWEMKGGFTLTPDPLFVLSARSELLPTPEPGTLALLGAGIAGLGGWLRRRN